MGVYKLTHSRLLEKKKISQFLLFYQSVDISEFAKANKVDANAPTEVCLEISFFGAYLIAFRGSARFNYPISAGNRLR